MGNARLTRLLLAGLLVASLASAGVFVATTSGEGAVGSGSAYRRVIRTYRFSPRWVAECGSDSCGVPALFRIPFKTPTGVPRVDVVVTVTFDVRTSPGDSAGIWLVRETSDGGTRPLRPGRFRVTAPEMTTTSITWLARDVPAGGTTQSFLMYVTAQTGADNAALATGTKMSVVIEAT